MMNGITRPIPAAPKMTRAQVDAYVSLMLSIGEHYVAEIGRPTISLVEWRAREYAKCEA